jgi:hypothetical protein
MEMVGVDPGVQSHVLKLASSQLCSNLNGQLMVGIIYIYIYIYYNIVYWNSYAANPVRIPTCCC